MSNRTFQRLRSSATGNIVTMTALGALILLIVVALFAPLIAPYDPAAQDLTLRLKPPVWLDGSVPGRLLGTDELGRDIVSRLLYGSRVSLLVGVTATVLSGVIGTALGLAAGYLGGRTESIIMRLADIQLGIPSLLLALAIIAAFGSGFLRLILILGITGWVAYARVVRSEVLSLRTREFVLAATAVGVTRRRIAVRHLLPNVMASVATIGTVQVASVIIMEASLSYLGLGVPPNIPTWGGMLNEGQLHLASAWWIAVFAGLAIMITTISINVVGDLLRDVSDPKTYIP